MKYIFDDNSKEKKELSDFRIFSSNPSGDSIFTIRICPLEQIFKNKFISASNKYLECILLNFLDMSVMVTYFLYGTFFTNFFFKSIYMHSFMLCSTGMHERQICAQHARMSVKSAHNMHAWVSNLRTTCMQERQTCAQHACMSVKSVQNMHAWATNLRTTCMHERKICAQHAGISVPFIIIKFMLDQQGCLCPRKIYRACSFEGYFL